MRKKISLVLLFAMLLLLCPQPRAQAAVFYDCKVRIGLYYGA